MHTGCRDGKLHDGKFQIPPCIDPELIPLSESDKQAILDFHNNQRNYVACGGLYKKFGLKPGCRHAVITWDKELEKTAFLHTSYCNFAHDKCRNTVKYPFSGQNLGIMSIGSKQHSAATYINIITYLWYTEYRDTLMEMIDSFYHQNEVMVGHFLTSLNERNNRVGCTSAKFFRKEKNKTSFMLSCNYPTTNIGKSTIYNSCKKPASKCITGTDPKYKYLCSSKEKYDVSGKLKFVPYDGDGSEVFNCGRQAEMMHFEHEGADEVRKLDKDFVPDEVPTDETTKKPPVTTTRKTTTTRKPVSGGEVGTDGGADTDDDGDDEDIFTDYCKPGLCEYFGGDGMHTGCRDGKLHDGKFQIPPCIDPELVPLSKADKQAILDFHNNQRNFVACGGLYKKFGLKPGCRHAVITWDKELEKTAFLHTSYCNFAHDKCRNTVKYPFSGQNLGIMSIGSKQHNAATYINIITYLWYTEYRDTLMEMIDSFYHQNEVMVGHFLTSLNERNNRVGCTSAKFFRKEKNKTSFMLSCNYPTTNIGKSTIYNSCKKPASKCITGTDPKYKYLCSSKEKYDVSGKLKFVPYDGDGSEVFNCGRQAEIMHLNREGAEEVRKVDKDFVPDEVPSDEKPTDETTKKPPVITTPKATTTKKPISGGGGGGAGTEATSDTDDDVGDEDIFTDYCKPGLCEYFGGDGMHTGCRDGKLHDGKFQIPPCIDPELVPLSKADKQAILDFHNNQRNYVACGGLYKKFGLKPGCRHAVITWDKELEKTAFLHTSYCNFAHDKCRNTVKYPFSGQNLGIMSIGSKQHSAATYINIITYLWYTEYRDTLMEMIDSFYHQNEVMVGHFLTSLNERNNRVGCTSAKFFRKEKNKTSFMLSCNYPTTNIGKSTIYNSCKKPASKCITGTDPKYKYLCSSKEKYDVSSKLKFVPYDGDGSEVFNCGRQAEMMHLNREGAEEVRKVDKDFVPDEVPSDEKPTDETTKKPPVITTSKTTTTKKPISGGGGGGAGTEATPDTDGKSIAIILY
ncbi:uncharacterized protein ACRADG_011144 [Cochliomyia hominivorax]